jgi:hypothetical protein
MGTSGRRGRKPKKKLPPVPHYERYPRGGFWRLGGPLTSDHEAEARAAARARRPGRIRRLVLKMLGGSGGPTSRRT